LRQSPGGVGRSRLQCTACLPPIGRHQSANQEANHLFAFRGSTLVYNPHTYQIPTPSTMRVVTMMKSMHSRTLWVGRALCEVSLVLAACTLPPLPPPPPPPTLLVCLVPLSGALTVAAVARSGSGGSAAAGIWEWRN
jgi:hypothetical protein